MEHPGDVDRRRRVGLGVVAATTLFYVGSLAIPAGWLRHAWVDLGWVVVDGVAAVACLMAGRAATDRSLKIAWTFFAAAMVVWTAGASMWAWHEVVLDGKVEFPSDTNYLGWVGAALFLAGVFFYRVGRVSMAVTLRQVADLGLMGASLVGLAIEILYPRVIATNAPVGMVVAAMMTPALGGLALVNGLVGMSQRNLGPRRRVLGLLLTGVATLAVVGTVYVYAMLGGTYRVGAWIDCVGFAGMLLVGWAALEERWLAGDEEVSDERGAKLVVLVPIGMTAAWMGAVIVIGAPHGVALWPLRSVVVAVLIVAMALRVWANHRISLELQRRVADEEGRRWRLEAQLMRSQKLEALGTLAGGIAHDFNNVLSAATATLYLARRRLARGGDPLAELDEIEKVMQRAAGLTDRLLGLANNRGQRRRSVDVAEVVGQVAGLLGKVLPPGVFVAQDLATDLPHIVVDPVGLEHALLNLGLNARDALRDGGGTITFVARHGDQTGDVVVEVADDGPGIPQEVLPRMFEPFFTTKPEGQGTGLGLAMVEAFASSNGVSLAVESKLGAGALFRLSASSDAGVT